MIVSFVILIICSLSVHAQQPNIPAGSVQTFPNRANNINGFNRATFPGQAARPGSNFNLQGTPRQGLINNFVGARGFSSPFRPIVPGRLPFTARGFGSPFLRPIGRPMPPVSPMVMVMMSLARNPNNYRYATCAFNDTSSTVRGRADFRQFLIGEGRQRVTIRLQLSGLPQAMSEVERGIHVHEFGDIGDGCARVGPHFNPMQTLHGSQRNYAMLRHVGNLGNIRQSADGLVSTQYTDSVISLEGLNSIVGRALVIKFERDDLGRGNNRESQINGNTHNPVACCTIGRTTPRNWYNPMTAQDIQEMAATGMMPEINRFDFNNMNRLNMNNVNNMNNPNMNNPNMNNPNMNNPNFNVPRSNIPNSPNFNGNTAVNNFNPGSSGMNNFVPNRGMNNINRARPQAAGFRSGTFFPGSTGQTFNFNNQGKKK